ncbi:MAG: DNA polymerase I [Candidatus Zixiibacteriota bacterium]|nr:MAG: DNA polymerase I [candidate division Zixibacteria bacterium]
MKRLILIDGSAVAFRSYFAFIRNPLINSRGENTGAVFGFVNSLNKIITDFNPDYITVLFDTPKPTFRHERYPEYKSTRAKAPDELVEQLPWIERAIEAFRITRISIEGLEADDLIGTLAEKAAAEKNLEILIFTGDKDFYQLVKDNIKILNPKDYGILDAEGVKEKFGVYPESVIDVLALMGDSSDNVPGVPGVGPKTAVSLVEEFGDLNRVLKEGPSKKKGKLAKSLDEYKEQAELSRELVTIKTDCPVELDLEKFSLADPDIDSLVELYRRLEFQSLAEKYASRRAETLFDSSEKQAKADYRQVKNLKELDSILGKAAKIGEIAIDTETTSLMPLDARLVGISFSFEQGKAFYIPVGHDRGKNLPLDEVLKRFRKLFTSDTGIIGQNLKYDRQVFKNHGIYLNNLFFDTMIAAYLINPGARTYNLDSLALDKFNYKKMHIDELIGSGKKQIGFNEVDIERATFYACEDADFALRLKNEFYPEIEKLKLKDLFFDIEMPLVNVLGDMEENGVKIDAGFLKELSIEYGRKLKNIEKKIFKEVGQEFNLNSPKQLGEILFDKLGLKSTRKTAKGGARSTSVDVLEKLAEIHPVPRMVLDYRQFAKLKSTYIDALPEMVNESTGRVHTSFNQTIAATGRLSSTDPNLQNIPVRTEEGKEIRKAFIPAGKGYKILSADYSQIELRIMAHIANDKTMIESFKKDEDIHRRTAAEVYGVDIKNVTEAQRRAAKTANFAIIYGVSAFGLSQQSELSVKESKDFIDIYFDRYPGIKKYMDDTIEFARKKGYVSTMFGRRRYLPDINAKSVQARQFAERIAINTPIQGSAADMIKIAMINIAKDIAGMKSMMILQVHDELVFDAREDEMDRLKKIIKKHMEGAVKLKVPVKVDMGIGDNWLEAH